MYYHIGSSISVEQDLPPWGKYDGKVSLQWYVITDVTVLLWQAIFIWVHTSVVLYLFYVIIMVAIPGGLAS